MDDSRVQLNDMPDEILLLIFQKLNNKAVLYSLFDVNERLNRIVYSSEFTNRLNLVYFASNGIAHPLPARILDRFCLDILPKINHQVKWLSLELFSMERILLAANFPNLSGLGLYNILEETFQHLFTNETSFICTLKNQILSLTIDICTNVNRYYTEHMNVMMFTQIFLMFPNLRCLNFGPSSIWHQALSFPTSTPTFISSNLLKLRVCLGKFTDCLYLLDGRFSQLHTLHLNIKWFERRTLTIDNKGKLPNLKSFSLSSVNVNAESYNQLILPLLHRMSNLEQLDLHLEIDCKNQFIDGNDLKKNIINHMSQLNKFTLNILICSRFYNQNNLPLNDDIQKTFNNFLDNRIISCVDYFPERKESQCHMYSYPYKLKDYERITNNFPGGLFKCVRNVSLCDERPFEHEFFFRIAQSFPLMTKLTIDNQKRQNEKRYVVSKIRNQTLSIIKYSHLAELDLFEGHKDYYEQFLLDTKMCLPDHLQIFMDYQVVKKVTRHFTRDATRNNCAKLGYIVFCGKRKFPEHFKDYFPHAQIK